MTATLATPVPGAQAHRGSMETLLVWDEVVAMTNDMLGAAGSGEWDTVRELEDRRRPRLHALLDQPVDPAHTTEVADNIEAILRMDEQITKMGREQMTILSRHLGQVRTGRQAVAAYEDQTSTAR